MEHPAGGTLLACIQRINELEGRSGSDFDEDGSSECCSTSSSATAPSASESSYLTDSKRFVPPPGAVAERVARNAHLHNGVNVLRKGSSDVAPACYEYVTSGGSFRVDDLCNVTRLMTRIPEDHKAEDVHETLELLAAAAGAVSKGRLSPAVPPDVRGKVTILALDVKLRLLGFDDFPFAPTLEDLCLDKETMNAKFAESNLAPPSREALRRVVLDLVARSVPTLPPFEKHNFRAHVLEESQRELPIETWSAAESLLRTRRVGCPSPSSRRELTFVATQVAAGR